jgi:T5SS/PEP-CTERM-associated repeat protein
MRQILARYLACAPRAPRLHPLALAAGLVLLAVPAQALVLVDGIFNTDPGSLPIGPGDLVSPSARLWIGAGGLGSLGVDGGSLVRIGTLSFGTNRSGNGSGLISGSGTRVELVGDAERLAIGDWGMGSLTVAAGAVLDTSQNRTPCMQQFHYCDSFVGSAAGDHAALTVTGAGSLARVGGTLFIGHPGFTRPPITSWSHGEPGATVSAQMNVLDGAEVRADRAQVGTAQWDQASTGFERSVSNVLISGAGSRWVIVGGQTWDQVTGAAITPDSGILTANDRYAVANIDVRDGGQIHLDGPAAAYNYLNLSNGGRTDMTLQGSGSALVFAGDNGVMQVGRALGSASMSILGGATASGAWYTAVGRDASFGELLVDGGGSLLTIDGHSTAAVAGSAQNAQLDIGRSGTGHVTVRNGGHIEISASAARSNAPQLHLGRGVASSGTLVIDGLGSVVSLSAASVLAAGGPGEAFNPQVKIGRDGSGLLSISNGGKLLMDGQAVSTVADSRSTTLLIGGTSETVNGGTGIALVSGAGSEIRLSGSDTYIGIGHGPQTNGQLTIENQGTVQSMIVNVGRSGGVGVLKMDAGVLKLAGEQTGNVLAGANLSIGSGGGTGIATIGNGSMVTLINAGSLGVSLNLGGTRVHPLGDGSLTLSGASQIKLEAATGLATVNVGRDGTGLLRLRGASSIDVGDGFVYVGRLNGSDGTVILSEDSTLSAGWLGVGRNRVAGVDVDGGTGTMVLVNSMVTASEIVIGTNGFLGGKGTINGHVTNHGIFSIGQSPGTMVINGGYVAAAGNRMIMEVQSDGLGGFVTDQLVMGEGSSVDLAALNVEFRFLGNTDPNAFQASGGFDVDTFFRSRGAGGDSDLAHSVFATASFTAQADQYAISGFTFSADGGALFTATPVPEPGSWALLLGGLLLTAAAARGQRRWP